jgi:NAD(P)H-flavin reductase
MGPTGAPTEIPKNETVLLAGGGLGNAVLFSIAKALKDNGNRVVYFAGYKKGADVFKRDEIEAGTDQVIWSTSTPGADRAAAPAGPRTSSATSCSRCSPTRTASSRPEGGHRIIAIGSDGMMARGEGARATACSRRTSSPSTSASARSTRRCSA